MDRWLEKFLNQSPPLVGNPEITEEEDMGVPKEWSEAFAVLLNRRKPKSLSQKRWDVVRRQIKILSDRTQPHLYKFIEYDWALSEVFGCHQYLPEHCHDCMGLMLVMTDSEIHDVQKDKIILKTSQGTCRAFYRKEAKQPKNQSTLMELEDTPAFFESLPETARESLEDYLGRCYKKLAEIMKPYQTHLYGLC